MRIIFLNIWHGHEWVGLSDFIVQEKVRTDIFCFLETDPELLIKIKGLLSGYDSVSRTGVKNLDGVLEGSTIFFKQKDSLIKYEEVDLYEKSEKETGGLLAIEAVIDNKSLSIGCVHGKSRPGSKQDTPERIKQSEILIDYYKNISGPKIIGGDFNLDLNTESVKKIESAGYSNLIKVFNIQNTRNELCWNQFPDEVAAYGKQYFADYCFVSPEVKVNSFEVPYNEISDHLPLILDFEI